MQVHKDIHGEGIDGERTKKQTAQQYVDEFLGSCRTAKAYFSKEVRASRLAGLQKMAELLVKYEIDCSCPSEAEDVVIEMSCAGAGRFVELLATNKAFVEDLEAVRSTMALTGSLKDVVVRAEAERVRSKEVANCCSTAQFVTGLLRTTLDKVREWFPKWGTIKDFLKARQGTPNGEDGDSARNGTNVRWQVMMCDGRVVLKEALPTDCSVAAVLRLLEESRTYALSDEQQEWRKLLKQQGGEITADQRDWVERLIGQLQKLETAAQVKDRSMMVHGDDRLIQKDATLLAFPFALGFQGKEMSAEYEQSLGDSARVASIVQEAMMGAAQRRFPSQLLNAWQLRQTAWTTATSISKDSQTTKPSNADTAAAKKRCEEQERLAEDFEARLQKVGAMAMGFSAVCTQQSNPHL